MTDTSRTHRCIDCSQKVEHTPQELCPSCGRCKDHCHGELTIGTRSIDELAVAGIHLQLKRIGEE